MRTLSLTALTVVLAAGAASAQMAPAPATGAGQTTTTAPAQPTTGQQANAPTAAGTAQTSATPTVGATIYGSGGTPVGTIESVTAQGVVINTGSSKVAVPTASIGTGPNGPTVSLTAEQLTAAAAQAQQAGAASLVSGATVKSSDGQTVGTVKSVDAQFVTLTTAKGAEVRLPPSGIANGPTGAIIGMTAAQFEAATAGAAPASSAKAAAAGEPTGAGGPTTSSTTTTTKKTTTKR